MINIEDRARLAVHFGGIIRKIIPKFYCMDMRL